MARTTAGSRSGMDEYELHGHLSEQLFRAVGGYFADVSSSAGSISQEPDSQQAVYLSYTSDLFFCRHFRNFIHFLRHQTDGFFGVFSFKFKSFANVVFWIPI